MSPRKPRTPRKQPLVLVRMGGPAPVVQKFEAPRELAEAYRETHEAEGWTRVPKWSAADLAEIPKNILPKGKGAVIEVRKGPDKSRVAYYRKDKAPPEHELVLEFLRETEGSTVVYPEEEARLLLAAADKGTTLHVFPKEIRVKAVQALREVLA